MFGWLLPKWKSVSTVMSQRSPSCLFTIYVLKTLTLHINAWCQECMGNRVSNFTNTSNSHNGIALFPWASLFFTLWFALTIKHGSGTLPLPCINVNANRRAKNRVGLGMRLIMEYANTNSNTYIHSIIF